MLLSPNGSPLPEWLTGVCTQWHQPGLAIAVTTGDEILYEGGVGTRKTGTSTPIDEHTIFAIASLSKSFAAASIGWLSDQGHLSLDDKVQQHLPHFDLSDPQAASEATIRDLLCNHVGLETSEGRHRRSATSYTDFLDRLRHQPFRHPFKQQFSYCSDPFTVIGALVAELTGRPWADTAQQAFWGPLGMLRTNADHKVAQTDNNSATPHLITNRVADPIPWGYEDHAATPAGGVNSSVHDMALWLQAHLSHFDAKGSSILSQKVLTEILTPHVTEEGSFADDELASVVGHGEGRIQSPTYALGWYCHTYHGRRVVYHTGSIDGFRSMMGFLPEEKWGVVLLANADNPYLLRGLFQTLVDQHLGLEGDNWLQGFFEKDSKLRNEANAAEETLQQERDATPCPTSLEALCGDYIDGTGFGDATITLEDGRLILTAGAASFELRPWSGPTFEGIRRAPYAPIRQFFATLDGTAKDGVRRITTTQGAVFNRRGH